MTGRLSPRLVSRSTVSGPGSRGWGRGFSSLGGSFSGSGTFSLASGWRGTGWPARGVVPLPEGANGDGCHPIAWERLGPIYEELGEREKAREPYEKFLVAWEDAEPSGWPRVERARQRLAGVSPIRRE